MDLQVLENEVELARCAEKLDDTSKKCMKQLKQLTAELNRRSRRQAAATASPHGHGVHGTFSQVSYTPRALVARSGNSRHRDKRALGCTAMALSPSHALQRLSF
jgi:hypothetical protein